MPIGLGRRLRLGLALDAHRGAAVVPAAVGARVVSALVLVAVRALLELERGQRMMRAPLALPGMRDTPLRNSHFCRSPLELVRLGPVAPRGQAGQARVHSVFGV